MKKRINSLIRFTGLAVVSLFFGQYLTAQAPVANPDMPNAVPEFSSISFNPLANDVISDVQNMEVTVVSGPSNGTVGTVVFSLNEFSITYSPRTTAPVFNGIDTLVYEVCDTSGGQVGVCDQAEVILRIGVFPVFPVAVVDTFYIGENVSGNTDLEKDFNLVLNDTLTTPGRMAVELVTTPFLGVFSLNNNTLTYQASIGNSGVFDLVEYAYCDTFNFQQPNPFHPEGYYCDTVRSAIYINQIHSSGNETGDIVELENLKILVNDEIRITPFITQNYLLNNIDPEGDTLLVGSIDQKGATVSFVRDGTFRYTPDPDLSKDGEPTYVDTLTYVVCDTLGLCVNDTMFLTIVPEAIDELPVLSSRDTLLGTVLLGDTLTFTVEASDPEGEDILLEQVSGLTELTVIEIGEPNNLVFSVINAGAVARTTNDTFAIRVCEVNEPTQCVRVNVLVTIKDTAQAPVAVDDERTILEEEVINFNIFQNDRLNGSELVSISEPELGTYELDSLTGEFTYTSIQNKPGIEQIEYVICRDSCDTALVKITIDPVYIPLVIEAVSPNGDGVNDEFNIQDVDYDELTVSVKIFNRWGNVVYEEENYDSRDTEKSWSGQASNGNLPDGTYFYLVEIPEINFTKSGDLLLISGK